MGPRVPARARSRAPSRCASRTATSTPARCTAPWRGWPATTVSISMTRRAVAGLASAAVLDVNGTVVINGHDVTHAIRTPEIDRAAAIVARHPPVRAVLVERQRAYGREGGIVMEGRDIGSVVFPDADRQDLSGCVARGAGAAPRARRVARAAAAIGGGGVGRAGTRRARFLRSHAHGLAPHARRRRRVPRHDEHVDRRRGPARAGLDSGKAVVRAEGKGQRAKGRMKREGQRRRPLAAPGTFVPLTSLCPLPFALCPISSHAASRRTMPDRVPSGADRVR